MKSQGDLINIKDLKKRPDLGLSLQNKIVIKPQWGFDQNSWLFQTFPNHDFRKPHLNTFNVFSRDC